MGPAVSYRDRPYVGRAIRELDQRRSRCFDDQAMDRDALFLGYALPTLEVEDQFLPGSSVWGLVPRSL